MTADRANSDRPLLDADAAQHMDRSPELLLRARTLAEGLYQGRHRTPDRGSSTEFYDFRAYTPGDPVSRLDWKVLARTDRRYIRRYQQFSQLALTLVVDASASMDFAGFTARGSGRSNARNPRDTPTKFRRACELAAALAYLAIKQGDRVGGVVADAEPTLTPATPGAPGLHALIRLLESARSDAHGVRDSAEPPLARALPMVRQASRAQGLVIVLTDALDEPGSTLDALAALRTRPGATGARSAVQGCDIAVLRILTPDELDPIASSGRGGSSGRRGGGSATLVDPETGAAVRTDLAATAAAYRRSLDDRTARWRAGLHALGASWCAARTTDDPMDTLRRLLAR